MNKAYFKESIFSNLKMTLFIFIIGLLIYPVVLLTNDFTLYYDGSKPTSEVGLAITYLAILCYIIPLFKFSYLHKKKQIDYYYSLPIKRQNILNINLLVGFMQIIIPYTIIYFLGMGIVGLKTNIYHFIWYLPLYGISVIVSLGVYLFNTFIYTRGNTSVDGFLLIVLYTFVFYLFFIAIDNLEFFTVNLESNFYSTLITFSPFVNIGNYFNEHILYYGESHFGGYYIRNFHWFNYIFPLILGVIGYLGLYFSFKYDKAERAEQITDSYFGYRIMIPLYYILIFFSIIKNTTFILLVILIIAYLVGEVIHYRKFKFPKKVYITMAICITAPFVLYLIMFFIASITIK